MLYATFKRQVTQEKSLTRVWVSWKSSVSRAGNPPGTDTRLPAGGADALAKRWPGGSGSTAAQAACIRVRTSYTVRFIKYTGDPTNTQSLHPPAGTVNDHEWPTELRTGTSAALPRVPYACTRSKLLPTGKHHNSKGSFLG